jgi:hypothetical protein
MLVKLMQLKDFTICQMNRVIIIGIMLLTFQGADAQTFKEWFMQKKTQKEYLIQQIAALKVYLKYLKEGYDIAKKGLNTIGDIKQGKFDLDETYLESLGNVNSSISGSARVSSILAYQKLVVKELRKLMDECTTSEQLTNEERRYVATVYSNMLTESENSLERLQTVITSNELEMKDDERIEQIDLIYVDMKDKYAFARSFSNSTRMLIMQRDREGSEVLGYEELVIK